MSTLAEPTLRDYFAVRASDGDIDAHMWEYLDMGTFGGIARKKVLSREQARYAYADAMLKAREVAASKSSD